MLTHRYLEVPTYLLTSIGSQYNEPVPTSSNECDYNNGEILKGQVSVINGRPEDSTGSSLVLLKLPAFHIGILFWLQNRLRSGNAGVNDFEDFMECTILFRVFLTKRDQLSPDPGYLQLGQKSEAYSTSIRTNLLLSAVLEAYSVGDRTQAASLIVSSPPQKQNYGDWVVWSSHIGCTSFYEGQCLNFANFTLGEVTKGFPSETQIKELLEAVFPECTLLGLLEPSCPSGSIISSTLFACSTCRKSFPTSELLQHHERTHVRPFQCETCYASFSWPKDLKRHLTKHSAAKSFSCPYCQLPFSRKDNVLRHLRNNHRSVQRTSGDKITLATFIEPATTCPNTSSSRPPTRGKSRGRNRLSGRKKGKVLAPCDTREAKDDNDDAGSPFNPASTPIPTGSNCPKRKIVCIFHRFDPEFYGNGHQRYRTCECHGFNFMSEHRMHLKRVHGITDCGEAPGCAPRDDSDMGVLDKWRMEYRKHCDPAPGAAESHCIFWDSDRSSTHSSVFKSGSKAHLENSDALPTNQMFHQGVMTRTSSIQTASSGVEQMCADVRGLEQQAIQSLSVQLERMQSDNDSLRTHNLLLVQHVEMLMRENQSLREDCQAIRAEQLWTTESQPGHPNQRLFVTESLPGLVSAAPSSLAYTEAFDISTHGTNVSFLETENDSLRHTRARNDTAHSMLHGPYLDMTGDLPQMDTTSGLTAPQSSAIDPYLFQDSRRYPAHFTQESARSDLEQTAGDQAWANLTPMDNGNAGKARSQIAFAPINESAMDWHG